METLQFVYRDQDILKEVTKRTSYLGKSRGTETQMHLLERLSLTEGESFLFDEFMADAVVEVYDWVKAFGRHIDNACVHEVLEGDTSKTLTFTLRKTFHFDDNTEKQVERYIRSALVSYIIYRWLEYVLPEEASRFYTDFEDNAQKAKNALDSEECILERRYNYF